MVNTHVFGETGDISPLDLRIVEIVEVIEDGHPVSRREQSFNEMGADETSPTCDQNSHAAKLAIDGADEHRFCEALIL
jgi:hypothetical protein